MTTVKYDKLVWDFVAECRFDPLKYVMGMFPWQTEPSIQIVPLPDKYRERFPAFEYGPEEWQCDFLTQWGQEMKARAFDGRTPVEPIRFSTVSGHGVGKSALTAWIVKFILDTRPRSVGTVTATTNAQLRTKTWAEVGKWHGLSLTSSYFNYVASSNSMVLHYKSASLAQEWKCSAQSSDPSNSESFAGQHAASSTSFYVFDEASGVDDKFFTVREGGLAKGEPMVFDFGNGTKNTGRFYDNCVGRYKHKHIVYQIDARSVHSSNKQKAKDDAELYGEDSDMMRVRWYGQFPHQAQTQFIDSTVVAEAQERAVAINHSRDGVVLGVDVSRQGRDSSVIYPRVGLDCRSFPARTFYKLNGYQLAQRAADYAFEFEQMGIPLVDIVVDGGGGYGGAVVDRLKELGLPVTEVLPQRRSRWPDNYMYVSDELWGLLRDALPSLALPARNTKLGETLYEQLTQRQAYDYNGKVKLEPKSEMADRIGSPDEADALSLTVYNGLVSGTMQGAGKSNVAVVKLKEFDPYEGVY